ncbi:uncharacterized protein M421DRAFT_7266 [Didymella exigua CBS 183.55]|uniref:Uncharacterized protein n=1 Tax=Didymella exigua CBS 183.55 TaxID=1150837 RepID=A0A6A5RHV4_9PLEO|nr:uncharacterized protein M421DRAFT_7266 [Didymella exigua CBS 183.55]KAF1926036.1 hypothetical protein M421DRAFT_7266 [Didymella exigua CBS 183.55]
MPALSTANHTLSTANHTLSTANHTLSTANHTHPPTAHQTSEHPLDSPTAQPTRRYYARVPTDTHADAAEFVFRHTAPDRVKAEPTVLDRVKAVLGLRRRR